MIFNEEIVGLILLDDVDRQHEFSEEEVELARAFADLAAVAVSQTRVRLELHSKLEAASRQLTALRRASAVDEQLSDLVLEGRSLQDLPAASRSCSASPARSSARTASGQALALPEGATESAVPRLLEPEVAEPAGGRARRSPTTTPTAPS